MKIPEFLYPHDPAKQQRATQTLQSTLTKFETSPGILSVRIGDRSVSQKLPDGSVSQPCALIETQSFADWLLSAGPLVLYLHRNRGIAANVRAGRGSTVNVFPRRFIANAATNEVVMHRNANRLDLRRHNLKLTLQARRLSDAREQLSRRMTAISRSICPENRLPLLKLLKASVDRGNTRPLALYLATRIALPDQLVKGNPHAAINPLYMDGIKERA